MRILAIEQELAALNVQTHASLLRAEAAALWALQQKDVIREIWFTSRDHRAVLLLECRNERAARRQLAALPLVRHHLIAFEVHPLRSYDGFARLFVRPVSRLSPATLRARVHSRRKPPPTGANAARARIRQAKVK
jgi:hypothetical protein